MRLLNKLSAKLKRKQPKLEQAPSPSKIWEAAGNLDRAARREDKLALRRAFRCRALPMSSVDRQNLAKIVMPIKARELERQAQEDRRYGLTGQP